MEINYYTYWKKINTGKLPVFISDSKYKNSIYCDQERINSELEVETLCTEFEQLVS